ncbi:sterol desaturase family protein [Stieleria varia]|uniref:Fatty acid hydroxylase domain-containing protein n=1 Tax=Stieleria varia TaxID=2528005 RepID=A0A5C6A4Z1_9BACT|nr:sterol desaturase family protein [Stieleria varia]TWT94455.1 hypothetical protein Pla52n_52760 [Stieleria varia]
MSEFATEIVIGILWRIPVILLAFSIGEWLVHKYLLHKPLSIAPFIERQHGQEHHGQGQNEIIPHIDLTLVDYFWTLPFFALAGFRISMGHAGGWAGVIALSSVVFAHRYFWNKIHRGIHRDDSGNRLENNWMTRRSWFPMFENHHLDHHRRPDRNFGVVFLWIDYAFRTKWTSAATRATMKVAEETHAAKTTST